MVMSITAISKKVFPFIFDFTVGVSALISILSLEIVFGFFFLVGLELLLIFSISVTSV